MTNDKSKITNKRVALVLGSGGARGLAHIGAIEALEERGYTITSIAGCSMGSIIAGMYASEERRESIDFSDPYFQGGYGLLVRQGAGGGHR